MLTLVYGKLKKTGIKCQFALTGKGQKFSFAALLKYKTEKKLKNDGKKRYNQRDARKREGRKWLVVTKKNVPVRKWSANVMAAAVIASTSIATKTTWYSVSGKSLRSKPSNTMNIKSLLQYIYMQQALYVYRSGTYYLGTQQGFNQCSYAVFTAAGQSLMNGQHTDL